MLKTLIQFIYLLPESPSISDGDGCGEKLKCEKLEYS